MSCVMLQLTNNCGSTKIRLITTSCFLQWGLRLPERRPSISWLLPHLLPKKAFFITALIKSLPPAFSGYSKESEDLFSIFTTWFGQYKPQSNTLSPHITTALQLRQQYFIDNWFQKQHFIHAISLDWTPAMNDAFDSTGQVQTIYLSKLPTAYLPTYHWMVESSAINNQWRTYIEEGK